MPIGGARNLDFLNLFLRGVEVLDFFGVEDRWKGKVFHFLVVPWYLNPKIVLDLGFLGYLLFLVFCTGSLVAGEKMSCALWLSFLRAS